MLFALAYDCSDNRVQARAVPATRQNANSHENSPSVAAFRLNAVRQLTLTECRVLDLIVPFGMLDGEKRASRSPEPGFPILALVAGSWPWLPFFRRRQFGQQPGFPLEVARFREILVNTGKTEVSDVVASRAGRPGPPDPTCWLVTSGPSSRKLSSISAAICSRAASEIGRFLAAACMPATIFALSKGSRWPERLTTTNGTSSSRS